LTDFCPVGTILPKREGRPFARAVFLFRAVVSLTSSAPNKT
jgi:hypothetical protein